MKTAAQTPWTPPREAKGERPSVAAASHGPARPPAGTTAGNFVPKQPPIEPYLVDTDLLPGPPRPNT
jgi:hypothetical protein